MVKSLNETINGIGSFLVKYFSMDSNTLTWWFIGLYFLLVVGFSFFYVSITFNTDNVAESIQKR
jgi:preprotein translocase subunit SecY